MPNLININAESQADIIGDDAQPTLRLRNTSTAPGLHAEGLAVTSTASVDLAYIPTLRSAATEGVVTSFNRNLVVASPTVATVALAIGSGVSSPVLELREQAFASATTILFTTGATAGVGAIRVKHGDNYGWIPVLPGGSVTAAPRG